MGKRELYFNCNRYQHPVGHGFFHTGCITFPQLHQSFNYIYDCGANNRSKALKREIEFYSEIKNPTKTIDLLVISHFHHDHYNGLLNLLKKYEIHQVIIPFLEPIEKISLIINMPVKYRKDYIKLVVDPIGFFQEHTNEKTNVKIIEENPPEDSNDEHLEEISRSEITTRLGPSCKLGSKFNSHRNAQEVFIDSDNNKIWDFVFYVSQNIDEKKVKETRVELENLIKKKFNLSNLNDFLKAHEHLNNSKILNDIAGIYKKIWVNKMNTTSLCMASIPVFCLKENFFEIFSNKDEYYFYRHIMDCPFYIHRHRRYRYSKYLPRIGWLGLGDAELRSEEAYNNILQFYGEKLIYLIRTMSIPHHGSIKNYNTKLISSISPTIAFYTTPTKTNKDHPSPLVTRDLHNILGKNNVKKVTGNVESGISEVYTIIVDI
jgi:hypothetical protein